MTDILELSVNDFRKQFMKLSNLEKKELILNDNFINCELDILLFIFNVSDDELKNIIINNEILLSRLLKATLKKSSKINVIEPKYQIIIIEKIDAFIKLTDDELFNLIKSMKIDIYKQFIDNLNNYIYDNKIKTDNKKINKIKNIYETKDLESIKEYLINKLNIKTEKLINSISLSFYNRNRNIFELYRLETYEQLYIYDRFNIVVSKDLFKDEMDEKYNISIELLNTLNSKHVIRIMNELKRKGPINDTNLFITSIKMYCLFGLDNSLKIINDKFTYSTQASITKAAELEFTFNERQYRLIHPDEFFNYEVIEKLRKSILANNPKVLQKILFNKNEEYVLKVFNILRDNYNLDKNNSNIITDLNRIIKLEIDNRQIDKKIAYMTNYYRKNRNKRDNVSAQELFELFSEFDTFNTEFDQFGNVQMNEELKIFLLGNEKFDNDCLLRMVFNKQALDYNNELINIINNYHKILEIKKNIKLNGNYSLLDTLDIYKVIRFKLEPDELDIPLTIISKISLSKKHLNVSEEESLNNFKYVYKEQKKKFSSTIPRVKGVTKDNYQYKVLDKNDPEILTCGIDTGNCFKPGGPGWAFYKYCLTSKYGDVISIKNPEGKLYICPIVRNGNGVYGNGIDPENIDSNELVFVLDALKKCYGEIIKRSNNDEKIEFCTLSDLHEYITKSDNYEKIDILKPPMIGEAFYCDITKNDINNYVLVGNVSNIKEYIPTIEYEIARNKTYVYSPDQTENKLMIEQKINEIEYRSIESLPITDEKKLKLKANYENIDIDMFSYVICNDDWYIAINEQYGLKSAILPYDPRAKKEFYSELQKINSNNKIINKIR